MAKVSMLAKLVVHDGKGDELIAAFSDLFGQVEQEPGTEVYVMNRSSSDPNVFWFYELYSDLDSLGSHGGSEAMKKAGATFGPLIAESELIMGAPVQAKGLEL
ncbi:MAG: antibiotic biosynthesis monooxygenase [Actinobacteria bacterium]|nr:antibiotic biosynthesis monooxygenase [Actinomycetota bacterium]